MEFLCSDSVLSRIRPQKMKNSLFIIAFIFIFVTSCSSKPDDVTKKYCDPSITSAKIDELYKCETAAVPEEVRQFFNLILLIKLFLISELL